MIPLGSETVILNIEDARKLIKAFLTREEKERLRDLQDWGVLDLLGELRDAVKRYDDNEDTLYEHQDEH